MAHTYSSISFHVVFSTKERRTLIHEPAKLWAYVAGTARNLHYDPLAVGGTENHLHLLLRLPGHISVAEATQKLKANSSRWLKEDGSWLGWQQGYGAFRGPSSADSVRRYIQNQPAHHRSRTFEEEFLGLLVRSGITFEKRRGLRVAAGAPQPSRRFLAREWVLVPSESKFPHGEETAGRLASLRFERNFGGHHNIISSR